MVDQLIQRSKVANPEPLIISDLKVNSTVCGWLFATEVLTRKASTGKTFIDLKLRDQRGSEIVARYFDPPSMDKLALQEGKVTLVKGSVEKYQNQIQIKLSFAETDESASADLFLPGSRRPITELEDNFNELMNKVDHLGLWELLDRCFSPEVMSRFRRWPAAVRHHGAVVGGLLEHTVNVTIIAERLAHMYSCNRNLVLAGALLHDIGKLEELDEQPGGNYTTDGRMFGHIFRGVHYVQEQAKGIVELDEVTQNDLLHIILAHHTKEFGSPVSPVTLEALIVHLADKTEASLTEFIEHCQRTPTDGWSTYSNKFGGQLRMP
jgi:3'-5' exoribonuclease